MTANVKEDFFIRVDSRYSRAKLLLLNPNAIEYSGSWFNEF